MNLTLSYILFLIDVDSFEDIFLQNLKKDEKMSHNLLSSLFNFVFKTFFSKAGESIVWDRSDSIIVLYPFPNPTLDQDVKKFSCSIARHIKRAIDENIKDFTVTIGIGSFYPDIMDIKNSYKEALTAIKVGKSVWGNNGVYHYDDLGVYRILAQFHDKKELESFVDKTIGNLLDYDKKKNTKLLFTLEQLLANNNNQKLTAEKMFIHPKTLAYRIKNIEEILGVSLNNAECRFSLHMALKILAMVDI
jgi:purine catabolism regulator